jgi:hypothetical protein
MPAREHNTRSTSEIPRGSVLRVRFQISPQQIAAFQVDVKAWETANRKFSQLLMGDADQPYVTTNASSPVIFTHNVDESFFAIAADGAVA